VARREAGRCKISPDAVLTVAGWSLAGGFIGARALFVVDHWSTYASDPMRSFAVREGGLAIQGALLGGLVAGALSARLRRLPVLVLADIAAPAVVLGQAIGRLGCLFTGDALGGPTSLPWGVSYTNAASMAPQLGVSVHPVFAYEAIWDLALFALLWKVRGRGWPPGRLFAIYLGLYAAGKFGLTFLGKNGCGPGGSRRLSSGGGAAHRCTRAVVLTVFRATRPVPDAAGSGSAAI